MKPEIIEELKRLEAEASVPMGCGKIHATQVFKGAVLSHATELIAATEELERIKSGYPPAIQTPVMFTHEQLREMDAEHAKVLGQGEEIILTLKAEVERLKDEVDSNAAESVALRDDNERLKSLLGKAEKLMVGTHAEDCDYEPQEQFSPARPCTCGLETTLAEIRAELKEGE